MGAVILNFSTIRESRSSPLHTFNSQAAISVNSGRITVELSIPCGIFKSPPVGSESSDLESATKSAGVDYSGVVTHQRRR